MTELDRIAGWHAVVQSGMRLKPVPLVHGDFMGVAGVDLRSLLPGHGLAGREVPTV
ncbi:hypothetical protein [Micromonospora humida]|uniref:hypothetical protein n=1 Tax=Micromonospora humida TaxID=2809018 RepID=UPI00344341CE